MLRHVLTAQKALTVLVVLSTHVLQGSTVPQDRAQSRLAQQARSAIYTIKIANCSALQAPIAQPVQANLPLSHQLMRTITMFKERQLIRKTNAAMAISVPGALQVPTTRPAQQTLYRCLEKPPAKSALLESGVLLDPGLNLTALLVSIVMELIHTPPSVLKVHLEQPRIFKVLHSALHVFQEKHVLKMD
jgi:hypothetical protein